MKLFKHFTYFELKDICYKLNRQSCYFRHPKNDFIKYLGKETVDNLIDIKFLKNSPSKGTLWDYKEDCYEYSKKFETIFLFVILPFWIWFKYYVLNIGWFINTWRALRIKCGHHYDWQDYNNVDLDDI